jgi:hypothetical protein
MADDSGHAASAHGAEQAADGTKQGRLAHCVQLHNV